MRSVLVVPDGVTGQFVPEGFFPHGHQKQSPRAFGFQRANESFDHGDAAVLTDGPESRLNTAMSAPGFESVAPELRSLVADNVLWRLAGLADRGRQKLPHLSRGRRLLVMPTVWITGTEEVAAATPTNPSTGGMGSRDQVPSRLRVVRIKRFSVTVLNYFTL